MIDSNNLQAKLKGYMQENEVRQIDIARKLGVSSATVSDWISGKKYPSRNKRQLIKEKLGIDLIEPVDAQANEPLFGTLTNDKEALEIVLKGISSFYLNNPTYIPVKKYDSFDDIIDYINYDDENKDEISLLIEPHKEAIRQDMAKAVTKYILTFYGGETGEILAVYKKLSPDSRHKLYEHAKLLLLAQERENEEKEEGNK